MNILLQKLITHHKIDLLDNLNSDYDINNENLGLKK